MAGYFMDGPIYNFVLCCLNCVCVTKLDHIIHTYSMRGTPQNRMSFWRVGPLWYRLPTGECSRNPSVSLYQVVLLWEAVFIFSEFFWRLFQCVCPFHDGWFMSIPAHTVLSAWQFLTKSGMTPMPRSPYSLDISPSNFFVCLFPQMKNVLKGKRFADMEEVKQTNKKMAEELKSIKINESKTVLSSGKNVSVGVLHEMESTLKGTDV